MSPQLRARLLEAASGAGGGAALGAASGAAFFRPDSPREWIEDDGTMGGRDLTDQERRNRRRTALRGALTGAALGAAALLGGSKARRVSFDRLERAHGHDLAAPYLPGLAKAQERFERLAQGGLGVWPRHSAEYQEGAARVGEEAKNFHQRVQAAAGRAKQSRDASFFGGRITDAQGRADLDRSAQGQLWRELSAKGVTGNPEEDAMAWVSEHRKKAFLQVMETLPDNEKVAWGGVDCVSYSKEDEPWEVREARQFLSQFEGTPFMERAKAVMEKKSQYRMEEARKDMKRAEMRLREAAIDLRRQRLITSLVETNMKKGVTKQATLAAISECESRGPWSNAFKGTPEYAEALLVEADTAHINVLRDELNDWSRNDREANRLYAELAAWRYTQFTKKPYAFSMEVPATEKTAAAARSQQRDFLLKEAIRLLKPEQLAAIAGAAKPSGMVVQTPLSAAALARKPAVYTPPKSAQKGWTGSWDHQSESVDLTPGLDTFEEQHNKARAGLRPLNRFRSPQTGDSIVLNWPTTEHRRRR